ncbi:glutathione S-transferase family protein (plasmid) [Pseudohalocynthiibacter aestuariivivens]|nr:glutathione S-transferase family protein [Pseudohalocynthiibacter aestuariivivens]
MITISAFICVPDFARGFVRDIRLRWALEEAGLAYDVELIDAERQKSEAYRAWQPFAQVPAYRDDDVELFESGAILLHLGGMSETLLPPDPAGQSRASAWFFAALNSIEPHAQNYIHMRAAGDSHLKAAITDKLYTRLRQLSDALGNNDYLEGRFSVGDIAMTTVLREAAAEGALAEFTNLVAYVDRNEARPAFQKALSDQLADFGR